MPYLITKTERCGRCGGTGYVLEPLGGVIAVEEPCPDCDGQGSIRIEARLEEALLMLLPWALAEIDRREQLAREEFAALEDLEEMEDLEEGENESLPY